MPTYEATIQTAKGVRYQTVTADNDTEAYGYAAATLQEGEVMRGVTLLANGGLLLTLHWHGWTIRQYVNGRWDAAHNHSPALSPGFQTFGDVMDWLISEVS